MRFTPQLRDLKWLVDRPIAHRGLHNKSKGILENTTTAFSGAIKNNYAIECDLQRSADGEAMVFHDESLDRLTAEKGLVRSRSVRQLQKLEITGSMDRMQTLDEMLEQVDGRVTLIIELKSQWDGNVSLASQALAVLAGYNGPYALMSFDPDLMASVAALSPHTVRGITADRTVDKYYSGLPLARRIAMRNFEHLAETRPHFVSYYFRDMPFPAVQNIRSAGHPVISWTIRSPGQESRARRWSDQITFEGYAA
jgi:glycerophosphoryl diester phosphodiesterase